MTDGHYHARDVGRVVHTLPDGSAPTAVVYDLDDTLVRLAVDWDAVGADLRSLFAAADVDAAGWSAWDCYERAEAHGLAADVERVLAEHERAGARRAERLPAADELAEGTVPVGVCSLNAEATCWLALETHGLSEHVDAVVGRDSVSPAKPAPEPLLATLESLGVEPDAALFVGNGRRDEETARRAGVPFAYVGGDGPTG